MGTNLSNKYSQKFLASAKKSTTDSIKNALKRATQKPAEATDDLIGKKIAHKITSFSTGLHSKKSPKEVNSQNKNEIEVPKESYTPPEKRQQIINELKLV